MTNEHLNALLEAAGAEANGEWRTLGGERTMTLHAASGGVGMNISKVTQVKVDGPLVFTQNARGELTMLLLADVFAGAVEGEAKTTRKAGFR